MEKLVSISQISLILDLVNSKTKKPSTHVLRYWEKEFTQIKPIKLRNRRYYTKKQIEVVKLIKFLLKDKGLTVAGVKNVLKSNLILEKIKKLKKNG